MHATLSWILSHLDDFWINALSSLLIDLLVITVLLPRFIRAYEDKRWKDVRGSAITQFVASSLSYRQLLEENLDWYRSLTVDPATWAERQRASIDHLVSMQQDAVQTSLPVLNPELSAPVLAVHFKWLAMMATWRECFGLIPQSLEGMESLELNEHVADMVILLERQIEDFIVAISALWGDHKPTLVLNIDKSGLEVGPAQRNADGYIVPEISTETVRRRFEDRWKKSADRPPHDGRAIANLMARMAIIERSGSKLPDTLQWRRRIREY